MAPVLHYITMTPREAPVAYLWFLIEWLSSGICIGVSIYFYRRAQGAWWLLVAFAFAVPLVLHVIFALAHGLPPLPYGLQQKVLMPSGQTIILTKSDHYTSTLVPLMAIAMFWGYLNDARKQAGHHLE